MGYREKTNFLYKAAASQTTHFERQETLYPMMPLKMALFEVKYMKCTVYGLANSHVKGCASLSMLGAVGYRPVERLKYLVQVGTRRMESIWKFGLPFGFPLPNWPFAAITLHGGPNLGNRKYSFTIKVNSTGKEPFLRRTVVACHCANIFQNQ